MEREILFNESFLVIEYDPKNNWVYTHWHGHPDELQIETGLNKILQCLETKKCSKVLNDNILVENALTQLQNWQTCNWFARAIKAGLRSIAYIYSHSMYSCVNREIGFPPSDGSYQVNNFKDTESAKAWLRSVA